MNGRDWFARSLAAAAAAVVLIPTSAHAELRRFTSEVMDTNRSYLLVYAPVLMKRLGPATGNDFPGILADWKDVKLEDEGLKPDTSTGGGYRLVGISVKTNPNQPTQPPEVDVVIEQDSPTPEGAPPPAIALIDSATSLQVEETADVLHEPNRTLYRIEVTPPRAALTPPGHRFYLNPNDRYEVQLIGGVRELVAGMRQTLPTFGGTDHRERSTFRRRR
jgi:hypothetical protein